MLSLIFLSAPPSKRRVNRTIIAHFVRTPDPTPFVFSEIVRRRRQHEYALQKRNKRVLDYDAYITTELTLLKLLRFRRKVSRDVASLLTMLTQQTADEQRYVDRIERSIITRLVRLHRVSMCARSDD